MAPTDVSICIVNWNGGDMLRNLLASLRTSDPELAMQTIVVDNASSDQSLAGAEDALPGVRIIRNDRNTGFARANNQCAAVATGRYLLFLNNDTLASPGAISMLARFLDEHPNYVAAGPKLIGSDGQPQHTGRRLPTLRVILHQRVFVFSNWLRVFAGQYRRYRYGAFDPEIGADMPQLAAAALLVRSDVFHEIGGWDEGYEFGVEDVDLCLRLGRVGPIRYLPERSLIHFGRITSQANYGFTYAAYECGYARYLRKHHRSRLAAPFYKVLITLDTPLRLAFLATMLAGYRIIGRRDAAERTRRRLSAAAGFYFGQLRRFWRS
ncbi:glycosyltransferase family 2 protein [Humisphaera borealis]|uniref:Glycosyltransferase family 2 protein n=1 Tax=Humisphaera borealis TaxID=2807512 RepID=A0A7M2WR90_9BACT|nr:glycosyltransferase family 2 protein [Humisphaera borealis]QOV87662.1 glycosyltransferase family 2 protein [Humisphaera borealis]